MRIFLALPTYDGRIWVNTMTSVFEAAAMTRNAEVYPFPCGGSLLPKVFNQLLAYAVNGKFDRLCMLHADLAAEPNWLPLMINEQDENNADVISAVVPLKDDSGLSSTAVYKPGSEDPYRLTLHECHEKLPKTFDVSDPYIQSLGGYVLGVNTGLMLMRLGPWVKQWRGFQIRSSVEWSDKDIRIHTVSEDWDMCLELAKLTPAPRVCATRAVRVHHWGSRVYDSHPPTP